jgi:hypothetical protein
MDFSVASQPIPIFNQTNTPICSSLVSPKVMRFKAFIDGNTTEIDDDTHNNSINDHEIQSDNEDNCGTNNTKDKEDVPVLSSSPQSAEMPDMPDDPSDDPSDNPSVPSSPPKLDAKTFRSIYMNCIARFHLQKEFYNSEAVIDELSSSPQSS